MTISVDSVEVAEQLRGDLQAGVGVFEAVAQRVELALEPGRVEAVDELDASVGPDTDEVVEDVNAHAQREAVRDPNGAAPAEGAVAQLIAQGRALGGVDELVLDGVSAVVSLLMG